MTTQRFSAPDGRAALHIETREAWREWLETHHRISQGFWLVSWKASTGRPRMSYEQSVEEALCFGWIDSRPGKLDDHRTML